MRIDKYGTRGWRNDGKLYYELIENRRKCSCGHTVTTLPASKHHKDYIVCNWCHQKVYRNDEKQKEHEKKVKRENFRMKMWGRL